MIICGGVENPCSKLSRRRPPVEFPINRSRATGVLRPKPVRKKGAHRRIRVRRNGFTHESPSAAISFGASKNASALGRSPVPRGGVGGCNTPCLFHPPEVCEHS